MKYKHTLLDITIIHIYICMYIRCTEICHHFQDHPSIPKSSRMFTGSAAGAIVGSTDSCHVCAQKYGKRMEKYVERSTS